MARDKLFVGCDFNAVLKNRCSKRGKYLQLFALPNGLSYGRFGQSVAKKTSPKAVSRNYMKRVIRHLFRFHSEDLKGLDVVLLHKATFNPLLYNDVSSEFKVLVQAIQLCRDSSKS